MWLTARVVDGALKCLGSLESLRREFGGGFELWIKVGEVLAADDGHKRNPSRNNDDDQAADSNVLLSSAEAERRTLELIAENFPAFKIVEQRQGRFTFSIPFESTSLSNVFDVIQRATAKPLSPNADETSNYFGISDYTVQQASLEQVFMRISNNSHHTHDGDSDDEGGSKAALIVPPTHHSCPALTGVPACSAIIVHLSPLAGLCYIQLNAHMGEHKNNPHKNNNNPSRPKKNTQKSNKNVSVFVVLF